MVVLGMSLNAMADFAEDFQEAARLFEAKDNQAAHEAFVKLAAAAPNAHGKEASLCYAAMALGRQKQYDRAIALAKTIEAEPMAAYTQMEIMDASRKHKELLASFADKDIAVWPDRINYTGFFLRGAAYDANGEKQAALRDFERCAELAGSDVSVKLEALNRAAALHHALGDDARAMDTCKNAFAIYEDDPRRKGRWTYPQALLTAGEILSSQKRYDEALAILAGFSVKPSKKDRGPWDFLVLEACGDILAAQGKESQAIEKYQDAIAIDTHQSYVDRVKKKVEALRTRKDVEPK